MYALTLLASLTTLIPAALSLGCSEFQTLSTLDHINANVSASSYGSSVSPFHVSDTLQCNSSNVGGGYCNSTACYLKTQPDVFIEVHRQLNLTNISSEVADQIFTLIKGDFPDSENVNTNASLIYSTGGGFATICIAEGMTGYWGVTPGMSCVIGNLNACDAGSGIENGTLIYACGVLMAPRTAGADVPVLGYSYSSYYTEAPGSPSMALQNATLPTSNSAISGADMSEGKILWIGILVTAVALALAM